MTDPFSECSRKKANPPADRRVDAGQTRLRGCLVSRRNLAQLQQGGHLVERHRPAEEVALHFVATLVADEQAKGGRTQASLTPALVSTLFKAPSLQAMGMRNSSASAR